MNSFPVASGFVDNLPDSVFHALPFAAMLLSETGWIFQSNDRADLLLEYQPRELKGKALSDILLVTPTDVFSANQKFPAPVIRKNKSVFHADLMLTGFRGPANQYWLLIIIPLEPHESSSNTPRETMMVEKTEKYKKLNRIHSLVSRISESIVRLRNPQQLFEEVCKISVEEGKFRMAWIGRFDAATNKIIPLAHAGYEDGYLQEALKASIPEAGTGPTGTALREGRIVCANNISKDAVMHPWRKLALARGYQSSVSIPIKMEGRVFGAFSLYSPVADFFTEEELLLLQRIVDDLSFALGIIDFERCRRHAEEELQKSEEKYRLLFQSNPLPVLVMDKDSYRYLAVNRAALKLYGYTEDEFMQLSACDIRPEQEVEKFKQTVREVRLPGSKGIWKHLKKNGEIVHVEIVSHNINYGGTAAILFIVNDVTEKIKTDKKIRRINKELRDLSSHLQNVREEERKQIARDIHDELGQQLTALKMEISWLSKQAGQESEVRKKIDEMIKLVNETMSSVRRITSDLRPSVLDHLGLVAALEWLNEEIEKRYRVKVNFMAGEIPELSVTVSTTLFRIYQEGLTNVVRHAEATEIHTMLRLENDHAILEICDDGKGFPEQQRLHGKGFGLLGIKERVYSLSGNFMISSEPGKGTCLKVEIPLNAEV